MKKLFCLLLILFSATILAQQKPRLVVGIVVDQMRMDYLYRFKHKFSSNGFKRLTKHGFLFKNAHYNYVPTYTAPGHASIYTGTTPSNHGIIGNNWYSRKKGLSVYCVADLEVNGVGGSDKNGKMSPKNLQVTTITDELLAATNFQSKVVGISIKDRGAILPAGHNPTGAYWFDSSTGNFITSTYYTDELPQWVTDFNKKKLVSSYLDQVWNPLLPINNYTESSPDNVSYERPFRGKTTTTFPYDLKELSYQNGSGLIRTTPWGNTLVMDMALATIEGEELGKDNVTDFLAVSFSSTDYVGHAFGPNSIELEDTYLRLDQDIAHLLNTLEKKFGNEVLVFLTADHGAANVPLYLESIKLPGGYSNETTLRKQVEKFMTDQYGEGDWILNVSNDQVFLNRPVIQTKKLDLNAIQQELRGYLLSLDHVADVFTANELAKRNSTALPKRLVENGFNTQKSGDVAIKHKSGYIDDSWGKQGTTHGSGYRYDTHIPIIFYGFGISHGTSVRSVNIVDIASTLAMLLNTSLPSASTGAPLKELFK